MSGTAAGYGCRPRARAAPFSPRKQKSRPEGRLFFDRLTRQSRRGRPALDQRDIMLMLTLCMIHSEPTIRITTVNTV